ncbi:MAG: translocation/assembly module TamB domain-containing protein [Pseudomonadales bacterium]
MSALEDQGGAPSERWDVVRVLRKTLKWVLLVALGAAIVLLLALSWVGLTESGTRWALNTARDYMPAELSFGEVQGVLASPLTLHGLHYASEELQLRVASVSVEWRLTDLFDRRLRVARLVVQDTEMQLSAASEDAAAEPPALPELPVEIELQQLAVTAFTITPGPEELPVRIDSLRAAAFWGKQQLTVTDLVVRSAIADLEANATLVFPTGLQALKLGNDATRLAASVLNADVDYRLPLSSMAPLQGELTLQGQISDLTLALTAQSPYGVSLHGSLQDVLNRWQADLQLEITRAQLGEINAQWPTAEVGYAARLTGNASELLIAGSGTVTEEARGHYESSLELVYSPQRLRIENAAVSQIGKEQPLRLHASGLIELSGADPALDVALNWQQLRWPLVDEPIAYSREGALILAGSMTGYIAQLNAHLSVPNQTDGEVSVVGSGSDGHFETETLSLKTLGGELSGSLRADWRNGLQSESAWTLVGIDPSGLAPDWPGAVDAQAQLTSSQAGPDAPIHWNLSALSLDGSLRDAALKGDFALSYEGDRLELQRGQLALGENQLSLRGRAEKVFALAFDLKALDLASLWPGIAGAVEASGGLTGTRDRPVVKAELQTKDLALQGRRLGRANLLADLGFDPQYASNLRLEVQAYQDESLALDSASVHLQGSQRDHQIDLTIEDELAQVQLAWHGRVTDLRALLQNKAHYEFALRELLLRPAEQPPWRLDQGGVGRASLTDALLEQTCLQSISAQVCLAGDWQIDSAVTLELAMQAMPLERLNGWLPADLQIAGQVDGGGSVSVAASALSADLAFSSTQISLFADADSGEESAEQGDNASNDMVPLITFEPGQLSLLAVPKQPFHVDFDLPLSQGGGLSASVALQPDAQFFTNSGISGSARAMLPDVRVVGELVPQVSRLQGTLNSELSFTGSVGKPVITGLLNFTDGEATLLGPDITLEDIDLSVSGTDSGTSTAVPLTVNGQMRSGEGSLALSGQVLYSGSALEADLALRGERFQLLNNKLAQVYASPDLGLSMRGNRLQLRGSIAIPEAEIALKQLPESAVVVSDDQVLISEDDSVQAAGRYTYSAAVDLALGDAVHFDGFGLDARFTGDLKVKQSSGEPALGNGEIRIEEGRYQAYGQDLKIETGRAIWTDSPLREPGIDLKATRNPRPDVTVGVRARGLLVKPEFSLFSEPSMGDSDQLSYLVLGRPLEDNSSAESSLLAQAALALGMRGGNFLSDQFGGAFGVDQMGIETDAGSGNDSAAFVVGKYLSPKIYVSYGLGLLDSVSTLRLEYLLSSRWRLVTGSSTIDSGGDLIYTIERD